MIIRQLSLGVTALLATALAVSSAHAAVATQSGSDRWLAWHGCWQAEGADDDELLCIVPDGAGVRMITVQGNAIVTESLVITDGRSRAVRHDDCTGTERAGWSADGRRVFLTSDLLCNGKVRRKVSGIFAFTDLNQWFSVQAVTIGDETGTRTVRYRAIEPARLPAAIANALRSNRSSRIVARQAAIADVDERDIDEALNSVAAVAVEEWLRATDQPFRLGNDDAYSRTSVLEQVGGYNRVTYSTREVVVVERPTYVHRTYVSRHYYSRYSPWGYDVYGWSFSHRPVIVVRAGPIIIRRGSDHHYRGSDHHYRGSDRYRDSDYYRRRSDDGRRGWEDDRDRGRVTREGYTRGGGRSTTSGLDRTRGESERNGLDRSRSGSVRTGFDRPSQRSDQGSQPRTSRTAQRRP